MKPAEALITLVLKLPHRPRSAVITTSSTRPPARGVSRWSSSGCAAGSTRATRLRSTRAIWLAYGRACEMRSCARRSLEAATIFIALVICCVDLTARIRRRMSRREGISDGRLLRRGEGLAELGQRLTEVALERIVDLLLLGEGGEQLRATRIEEGVQVTFVIAHLLDWHPVEEPVVRGVDDDDLLLDRQRLILRLFRDFDQA